MTFHLPQRSLLKLVRKQTHAWGVGGRTRQDWEGVALCSSPQREEGVVFSKHTFPADQACYLGCHVSIGRLWVNRQGSGSGEACVQNLASCHFSNTDQNLGVPNQLPAISRRGFGAKKSRFEFCPFYFLASPSFTQ